MCANLDIIKNASSTMSVPVVFEAKVSLSVTLQLGISVIRKSFEHFHKFGEVTLFLSCVIL